MSLAPKMITSRVKCVTTLHTFPGMSETKTTFSKLSRPTSPTTTLITDTTTTTNEEDFNQYEYVTTHAPRIMAEAMIEIVGDPRSDAYLCYSCRLKPNQRMLNRSVILGGADTFGGSPSPPRKGSRPRSPTVFLSLAPCCRDEECQSLVRSVNDNFIQDVATARSPVTKTLPVEPNANKLMEDLEAEIAQSLTL